jgi:hypothetical protein
VLGLRLCGRRRLHALGPLARPHSAMGGAAGKSKVSMPIDDSCAFRPRACRFGEGLLPNPGRMRMRTAADRDGLDFGRGGRRARHTVQWQHEFALACRRTPSFAATPIRGRIFGGGPRQSTAPRHLLHDSFADVGVRSRRTHSVAAGSCLRGNPCGFYGGVARIRHARVTPGK